MMIAFCLDSDFDALPGDTYYDGSDPQQHLNWTTDFTVFDAKQRKDRDIAQSTKAALTDKSGYDSNGIKHLKVTPSEGLEETKSISQVCTMVRIVCHHSSDCEIVISSKALFF